MFILFRYFILSLFFCSFSQAAVQELLAHCSLALSPIRRIFWAPPEGEYELSIPSSRDWEHASYNIDHSARNYKSYLLRNLKPESFIGCKVTSRSRVDLFFSIKGITSTSELERVINIDPDQLPHPLPRRFLDGSILRIGIFRRDFPRIFTSSYLGRRENFKFQAVVQTNTWAMAEPDSPHYTLQMAHILERIRDKLNRLEGTELLDDIRASAGFNFTKNVRNIPILKMQANIRRSSQSTPAP